MIKSLLLSLSVISSSYALTAEEFNKQQMSSFETSKESFGVYKKSQEEAFEAYQKAQMKAFEGFKKEVGVFWEDPKMPTQTSLVTYTPDKKTRADIDFKNQEIIVETIAASPEAAKKQLEAQLALMVSVDTKKFDAIDPLEQTLSKIKKPAEIVTAEVKPEPILSTVIFGAKPSKKELDSYVQQHISKETIKVTPTTKVPHQKIYSVTVKMPEDAMVTKSKDYYDEVKKQSGLRKLPMPLVFAIMHSESSFNPKARSHVPAYGLMQIVPKTAGRDTYKFLYKQDKLVTGDYLYNSTNNITMGAAYLHILYYNYLREIKNDDSRLYCAIAAYNTGAGNIAWAFTKTYNMKKAAPLINALSPDEVYNKLLKDLRFDEPKHYLKKVSQRMSGYHKIYGI